MGVIKKKKAISCKGWPKVTPGETIKLNNCSASRIYVYSKQKESNRIHSCGFTTGIKKKNHYCQYGEKQSQKKYNSPILFQQPIKK